MPEQVTVISVAEIESIARGVVAPVARAVNKLEAEMANVEGAVDKMHHSLVTGLEHMTGQNSRLIELQQTTQQMTREQFIEANTQLHHGFGNVVGGLDVVNQDLHVVDSSVKTMSRALVQMEVIRLLNEAKGPLERVKSFQEEIDQRFAKAVENVFFVRTQYDKLLLTAMTEYERKLRTIGDHIYRIYDEDFGPSVEGPLSAPSQEPLEHSLRLDEEKLDARSRALDANLAALGEELLAPLLDAQREFEHVLSARYAAGFELPPGELVLPVAVQIFDDPSGAPRVAAVAGARVTEQRGGQEPGVRFTLSAPPAAAELTERLERVLPGLLPQLPSRPMQAGELAALRELLEQLAHNGAIAPELLQGYCDYLDTFGLDVLLSGNAAPSTAAGPAQAATAPPHLETFVGQVEVLDEEDEAGEPTRAGAVLPTGGGR